jgi:hypothetical protein
MKVRFINEMNRTRLPDRNLEETRSPHRALPKKSSWEEVLARFQAPASPPAADTASAKGTVVSKALR